MPAARIFVAKGDAGHPLAALLRLRSGSWCDVIAVRTSRRGTRLSAAAPNRGVLTLPARSIAGVAAHLTLRLAVSCAAGSALVISGSRFRRSRHARGTSGAADSPWIIVQPVVRAILALCVCAAVASCSAPRCSGPGDEAEGVAWERLSGQIAYSRWQDALSPRGSRSRICLIDANERKVRLLRDVPVVPSNDHVPIDWVQGLALRNDGSTVTFGVLNAGDFWELHDLPVAGAESTLFPAYATNQFYGSWSPDGRLMYLSWGTSGSYLRVDGAPVLEGGGEPPAAWTPDGAVIISRNGGHDLTRYDLTAKTMTPLVTSNDVYEYYDQPAASPDGSRIAFIRRGSELSGKYAEELWMANADGSSLMRLTMEAADEQPAWSRDGRSILFNRNRVGLLLDNVEAAITMQVTSRYVDYFSWRP